LQQQPGCLPAQRIPLHAPGAAGARVAGAGRSPADQCAVTQRNCSLPTNSSRMHGSPLPGGCVVVDLPPCCKCCAKQRACVWPGTQDAPSPLHGGRLSVEEAPVDLVHLGLHRSWAGRGTGVHPWGENASSWSLPLRCAARARTPEYRNSHCCPYRFHRCKRCATPDTTAQTAPTNGRRAAGKGLTR
jgi:hypothetical protein